MSHQRRTTNAISKNELDSFCPPSMHLSTESVTDPAFCGAVIAKSEENYLREVQTEPLQLVNGLRLYCSSKVRTQQSQLIYPCRLNTAEGSLQDLSTCPANC